MRIDLCFLLIFFLAVIMALHGLCLLLDYLSMNIQMKATVTEKYFLVVLFITLYKMVLTFESENKILKCDHSNESY